MARTQAPEFEERRERIVERAAELYAERGFLGASIADLAELCQTSKSLIYHYYAAKEDILFEAMHSHVSALLEAAEAITATPLAAREKLAAITRAFVVLYVGAAARHKVLLNELKHLPPERQAAIVGVQRRLIAIVEAIIEEIQPALAQPSPLARPATMLYFGMINWMHTWFNPQGAAKPEQIAELAIGIFLDGIASSPAMTEPDP